MVGSDTALGGRTLISGGQMPISYNEPVTFGARGSAREYHVSGFDFSENGPQSWTVAPVAELDLVFPFTRNDLVMDIEVTPYIIPEAIDEQKAFIFVGGLFTGFLSIRSHSIRSFPLARPAVSGRSVRLSLAIPTAASPASLRISADERELGLLLTSLTFKTVA